MFVHKPIHNIHKHTHVHTVPSGPPSNVRAQVLTSSAIQVTWSEVPIRQQHGTITNYDVEYKRGAFNVESVNVAAPTLMVDLTLLREYTEYLIRVRAYTSVGPGPYSNEISATTLEDRKYTYIYIMKCDTLWLYNFSGPSESPMNIVITLISSTSFHVLWDPVPEMDRNGIITNYDVTYSQSTFQSLPHNVTVRVQGDDESVTLTGLEEYVVYSITVRAYTAIGAGPYSPLQNRRTLEDGKI